MALGAVGACMITWMFGTPSSSRVANEGIYTCSSVRWIIAPHESGFWVYYALDQIGRIHEFEEQIAVWEYLRGGLRTRQIRSGFGSRCNRFSSAHLYFSQQFRLGSNSALCKATLLLNSRNMSMDAQFSDNLDIAPTRNTRRCGLEQE